MAWNEPGGSKDNDPWRGRPDNDQQGPPDLDEVVRKLQDKLGGVFGRKGGGGGSSSGGGGPVGAANKGMLVVAGIVILVIYAYACFYVVAPAERAAVLRFGKLVDVTMPGPHWAWWPIETVTRENVEQIRTAEIGYRVGGRGGQSITPVPKEALMLTRDENIVDIRFAVQYRIKDLGDFLFEITEPEETLKHATESAVREVVGKSDMDFVLTEGRSDIVAKVGVLTQEILDRYQSGLQVTSVNMQDAQPPEEVQAAFNDAVKAREDQQRLINEAETYANDILPKARGKAQRQIEEANGFKEKVIAQAEGEAARFEQILTEYAKAPEVTRQRLYLETMEQVYGQTNKVVIDVSQGNNVMFLPLDRMGTSSSAVGPIGAATDFSAQRLLDSMTDSFSGAAVPSPGGVQQGVGIQDTTRDPLRSRERP